MKKRNNMSINRINGGGNFADAELAFNHHALFKGRLSSYLQVIVVLFAFLLSFSSCSNDKDKEENIPQVDYKAMLTSHEWEITSAIERMGSFGTELKDADAFCKVSADSIYFQKGETNHYFDSDGKITSKYEITPCGSYPYSIEGEKIKIESQIFMITSQADGLVLTNEDWRLVLKNK